MRINVHFQRHSTIAMYIYWEKQKSKGLYEIGHWIETYGSDQLTDFWAL